MVNTPTIRHSFPLPETVAAPRRAQHHDPGVPHAHTHCHEGLVSRRLQIATAIGNVAIGAVETVAAFAGSAFSGVYDGVHNLVDGVTYWKQFENLRGRLTERQRQRNRKLSYWLLSTVSLGLAAKAGFDFAVDHETEANPLHLYASGASLALNIGLLTASIRSFRRKKRVANDCTEAHQDKQDLYKHFLVSDIPSSAAAVFGAVMHRYGLVNVEQLVAAGVGGLSAWVFRPTRHNLERGGHGHAGVLPQWLTAIKEKRRAQRQADHEARWQRWLQRVAATHQHPLAAWAQRELAVRPTANGVAEKPKTRPMRRTVFAGMAALSLVGVVAIGEEADRKPSQLVQPGRVVASVPPIQPALPVPEAGRPQQAATTTCITIKKDDSQWRIAEQLLAQAAPGRASDRATRSLVGLTSRLNKDVFPNPHVIRVGGCLVVPTVDMVRTSYKLLQQDASPAVLAQALNGRLQ